MERESDQYIDNDDIFEGYGIRIKLPDTDGAFLKVKETLSRMGISSRGEDGKPVLTQSCHILHKRGQYAIVHFKELFAIDGRAATLSPVDFSRRDVIAMLLSDWELVTLLDDIEVPEDLVVRKIVTVIPFSEKKNWTLRAKYSFGGERNERY